jgi:hypothetical protein
LPYLVHTLKFLFRYFFQPANYLIQVKGVIELKSVLS